MKNRPKQKDDSLELYGWPIFLAAITTILLVYFAIARPETVSPEKCVLQLGLNCKYHHVDATEQRVFLTLQNEIGKGIIITQINVSGDNFVDCFSNTDYRPFSTIIEENTKGLRIDADEEAKVTVHCKDIIPSDRKVRANISIRWYNDDADKFFTHTMAGYIFASIKKGEEYCCCRTGHSLGYDMWIKKETCNGILLNAEPSESCSAASFHDCEISQENCCHKNNVYFWGGQNCSGHADWIVDDGKCEY